jgi:hypothetical protein
MNYYSVPDPWKVPKWIGAILGCAFLAIAVGTAVTIVHLTRPAAAAVLQTGTPRPAVPALTAAETLPDTPIPPGPITRKHAAKQHVVAHHKKKALQMAKAKHGKHVLLAKRTAAPSAGGKEKAPPGPDALDKILGLK